MSILYVVKDGLKHIGYVSQNGEQAKNTNFYLLTYGKGNVGYIEKKSSDIWRLYTLVGQQEAIRKLIKDCVGESTYVPSSYYHFATFEKCVEKLKELKGNSLIEICDSDSFPLLISRVEKK